MQMLAELFLVFFKIGAVTFGGGYAMLPILQKEIVVNKKWGTDEELMDYFAIGQCTPGMIAVNVATFIGYKRGGYAGGIFATLGVITPSMIIITLIAMFLTRFQDSPLITHAFAGIRACVCVLILDTVIQLGKKINHRQKDGFHFSGDSFSFSFLSSLSGFFRYLCRYRRLFPDAFFKRERQD